MNAENSITPEQIIALFRTHGFTREPTITRMTAGFTNEVYTVGDYILKVCVKVGNEPNFEREVSLYRDLHGLVTTPKPIVVDTSKTLLDRFYMIYPRLDGEPVGRRWHLLTDTQRRELVSDLCQQLRRMDNYPIGAYVRRFGIQPDLVWKDEMRSDLLHSLEPLRERALLPDATLHTIETYIHRTASVLNEQKLALTFWDVQWDNMLINSENRLAGLIDFEGISITSIDFRLVFVRIMMERPHLFMSEEMEPYAKPEDYVSLMDWYRQFYPELFDFPDMETRLDLYELRDVLHHLPAWPKTKQLHDRLARILAG